MLYNADIAARIEQAREDRYDLLFTTAVALLPGLSPYDARWLHRQFWKAATTGEACENFIGAAICIANEGNLPALCVLELRTALEADMRRELHREELDAMTKRVERSGRRVIAEMREAYPDGRA